MENTNYTDQLEQMRKELNDLKLKVENKGRLNDNNLRTVLQTRLDGISRRARRLMVCILCQIPLWTYLSQQLNLSNAFLIATYIILLVSMVALYLVNKTSDLSMTDDLKYTAQRLVEMKKRRQMKRMIGIPVALVWVGFLIMELQREMEHNTYMIYVGVVVISAFLGLVIGTIIYRKFQRSNDEMIQYIEELEK